MSMLAFVCRRLCTFKLSGKSPSCRIFLNRNVNVPGRAAETDSPLPPAPLHHAALSPTHFPYRIRTAYIFELCIWLRPAACGKIPFTRYFGRDFSRYYGLLFRFCWRLKPVPASSYLTVPFGAGGIFPAGCSGSVHWSLNTVPVDSSEPLPPGIAAHCPALSVYILSVAHLSDHALRDSYEQAERFFALHASSLYENGKPLAVLCSTGLLWPALDAFLPEDSGIL